MFNQRANSKSYKSIARTIIIALVIVILAHGLDFPARHAIDFLTAVLEHTVVLLPSLTMTAWNSLHPAAFDQPHFSLCALGYGLLTSLVSST